MITHDMPDAAYHSRPELSSTGARLLLPEYGGSPAKFQWAQTHRRESRAFDVGHAVHAKILGVGAGVVEYPSEHLTPSGNVSTKAATVAWETCQRDDGLVPISPIEARKVNAMAESALAHDEARTLLERLVTREVSIITDVDGVPIRARFDLYNGVEGADLKTAEDASPDGFTRSVTKYGLNAQEAWYRDAHKAETGNVLEQFSFLVIEKTAPYLVAVYDLDIIWQDIGREQAARARQTWAECTETGTWPGYESGTLSCPPHVIYRHEEASGLYEEVRV